MSFPGVINQFTPTQTDMKTMVVPRGTWTVTGTIAVPSGCTLIVEAGAVLRFQSGKGLTVSGSSGALPGAFFQAIGQDGTENGLAVFTSDSDSKGPGQWSRFLFGEGSRVMMQYCRVECGGQGFGEMINVDNGATVTIYDSEVRHASQIGLNVRGNDLAKTTCVDVERTTFSYLQTGPSSSGPAILVGGASPVRFTLRDSFILNTGPTAASRCVGLKISGTQDPALVVVDGNTFGNNSTGILFDTSTSEAAATVGRNTFLAHSRDAIRGSWKSIARSVFGVPAADVFSVTTTGYAGIVVDGGTSPPTTDSTLEKDGSARYLIPDNSLHAIPLVGSGRTLTIAEGVRLEISPGVWLGVSGRLDVQGKSGAEVTFTRTLVLGGWIATGGC